MDIILFELRDTTVSMNWENTFRLNGQLRYYILTRNNFTIRQDDHTSIELPNQLRGERKDIKSITYDIILNMFVALVYAVTVVTDVGQITADPIRTEIIGNHHYYNHNTFITIIYIDTIAESTTTTAIQPTSSTTSVPVSTTTTMPILNGTIEIPTTEEPIVERPEFIVAMVFVGLVVILMLCVVMLCFVRPKHGVDGRRRRKQPLTLSPYTTMLTTPSPTASYDYNAFPSQHGWVPNQPAVVGITVIKIALCKYLRLQEGVDDKETLLEKKRTGHYSPRRAQQRLDTEWQTDDVDVVKSDLVRN